jgi:nanoRNase/pAp phosphatase (c-di-AMP/oligoRNAs hydrolase)
MDDKEVLIDFKAYSARLIETIGKYPRLLIYIKGSPDPDAIAASFALKLLCESHGSEAEIVCPKEPSLPQNIKIIKNLHLPIRFKEAADCKEHYDAYAVLDHQSVFIDDITGVIPCAIHIDHHQLEKEQIPVDLPIHAEAAGSTSTIMIHLIEEMGIDLDTPQWRHAATAFYYGIQTDTDDFQHAENLDFKALEIISLYADKSLLSRIHSLPFTKEATHILHRVLMNLLLYKDWLISGIGYIEQKNRDTMGIVGDFLLKRENVKVVVVFGIVEKDGHLTLDALFRTQDENLNLNALIKQITREGGARKFKGAFQVDLDYFINCPNREMLWQTVYKTTLENLKKQRNEAASSELQRIFGVIRKRIQDLFP